MVRGEPDPAGARPGRAYRLQVLPRHREHRGDPLNGRYAALLGEGSRLAEGGAALDLRAVLTVLAAHLGAPEGSDRSATAVGAGLAEEARMPAVPTGPGVPAGLTTWVLPAAATALAAGDPAADVAAAMEAGLRDVAAALMVVHAPGGASAEGPPGDGLLLGHALAAGWLATELWAAGLVGVLETFERTVASVTAADVVS